jgi:NAD+ kinase
MKLGIIADKSKIAKEALNKLKGLYSLIDIEREPNAAIDIIIILGGDGFMLHSMHNYYKRGIPFYGMNCGTIGFLLNEYKEDNLLERIKNSKKTKIYPLEMQALDVLGNIHKTLAFNEVSMLRETRQSTDIKILIDGKERINNLIADGILVSTPAGSSAYNYSVKGPIIPLDSNLLALTPISPFRPRQWRGALLHANHKLKFIINNYEKRPVSCVADYREFRDVIEVQVNQANDNAAYILFDEHNLLEDKILTEQFLG